MGLILLVVGGIVMFVGGILLLVAAFKESVLWGLGSLLVPFVSLIFVFVHWDKAKKPFFVWLIGLAITIAGAVLTPNTAQMMEKTGRAPAVHRTAA
jgi:uncharacterized membrane protein HdeD (DUF308 family)